MFLTMCKHLAQVAVVSSLIFAVGCKSKSTVEDTAAPTNSEMPSDEKPVIDSQAMTFDAQGSDSGKINGLQSINFEYDKAAIGAAAKKKLNGNAEWMKSNPNVNLQIEGHCDARGSIEYNLALGERRAQVVKNFLVGLGIASKRLSVISYGKERPLAMGDNESAHNQNRRANFVPLNN